MLRRKPIDARQLDLQEKVIEVRRVTKVVKGWLLYTSDAADDPEMV